MKNPFFRILEYLKHCSSSRLRIIVVAACDQDLYSSLHLLFECGQTWIGGRGNNSS